MKIPMASLRNANFVRAVKASLLLIVLLVSVEREARAYTDPGSGALIWQMLAAGFVGVMFYFRKIGAWFRSRKKDTED